jgi:hypothetical protein
MQVRIDDEVMSLFLLRNRPAVQASALVAEEGGRRGESCSANLW